jgi:hypothetical protein
MILLTNCSLKERMVVVKRIEWTICQQYYCVIGWLLLTVLSEQFVSNIIVTVNNNHPLTQLYCWQIVHSRRLTATILSHNDIDRMVAVIRLEWTICQQYHCVIGWLLLTVSSEQFVSNIIVWEDGCCYPSGVNNLSAISLRERMKTVNSNHPITQWYCWQFVHSRRVTATILSHNDIADKWFTQENKLSAISLCDRMVAVNRLEWTICQQYHCVKGWLLLNE